jgi:N-acetylmuramoyl-L-alanine amidase
LERRGDIAGRIAGIGRASGRLARVGCALALAAAWMPPAAPVRAAERFDTVVLDPGHGGDDLGARGPGGLLEKELVLDLARRVRDRLEREELRVVMTRDQDAYVSLERRTAIANAARGDLFISIHANAASAREARGVETFFLSLEASDDAARQVAARENAAFREEAATDPGGEDPLLAILGDLAASEQMQESDEFARLAQSEVAALDGAPSRGVKQAPFVVLMGVEMPASLVEVGFVTNPREARALASAEWRDRLAEALARAVLEFGRRYDVRRGVDGPPRGRTEAAGGG